MRGGYKIADFKNLPLTSGEETGIVGMYNTIANKYKKPVVIENLIVGDVVYPSFYALFFSDAGNYSGTVVLNGQTITISVTPDDNVTVTVAGEIQANTLKAVKKTTTK